MEITYDYQLKNDDVEMAPQDNKVEESKLDEEEADDWTSIKYYFSGIFSRSQLFSE